MTESEVDVVVGEEYAKAPDSAARTLEPKEAENEFNDAALNTPSATKPAFLSSEWVLHKIGRLAKPKCGRVADVVSILEINDGVLDLGSLVPSYDLPVSISEHPSGPRLFAKSLQFVPMIDFDYADVKPGSDGKMLISDKFVGIDTASIITAEQIERYNNLLGRPFLRDGFTFKAICNYDLQTGLTMAMLRIERNVAPYQHMMDWNSWNNELVEPRLPTAVADPCVRYSKGVASFRSLTGNQRTARLSLWYTMLMYDPKFRAYQLERANLKFDPSEERSATEVSKTNMQVFGRNTGSAANGASRILQVWAAGGHSMIDVILPSTNVELLKAVCIMAVIIMFPTEFIRSFPQHIINAIRGFGFSPRSSTLTSLRLALATKNAFLTWLGPGTEATSPELMYKLLDGLFSRDRRFDMTDLTNNGQAFYNASFMSNDAIIDLVKKRNSTADVIASTPSVDEFAGHRVRLIALVKSATAQKTFIVGDASFRNGIAVMQGCGYTLVQSGSVPLWDRPVSEDFESIITVNAEEVYQFVLWGISATIPMTNVIKVLPIEKATYTVVLNEVRMGPVAVDFVMAIIAHFMGDDAHRDLFKFERENFVKLVKACVKLYFTNCDDLIDTVTMIMYWVHFINDDDDLKRRMMPIDMLTRTVPGEDGPRFDCILAQRWQGYNKSLATGTDMPVLVKVNDTWDDAYNVAHCGMAAVVPAAVAIPKLNRLTKPAEIRDYYAATQVVPGVLYPIKMSSLSSRILLAKADFILFRSVKLQTGTGTIQGSSMELKHLPDGRTIAMIDMKYTLPTGHISLTSDIKLVGRSVPPVIVMERVEDNSTLANNTKIAELDGGCLGQMPITWRVMDVTLVIRKALLALA